MNDSAEHFEEIGQTLLTKRLEGEENLTSSEGSPSPQEPTDKDQAILQYKAEIQKLNEILASRGEEEAPTPAVSQIVDSERQMNASLQKQIEKLTSETLTNQQQTQEYILKNHKLQDELTAAKSNEEASKAELQANIKISNELTNQIESLKKEISDKSTDTDSCAARTFILETDLSAAQIRIKDSEESLERKKEKIQELTKKLQASTDQLNSKDRQIEALKMANDKIAMKIDGLSKPKQTEDLERAKSDLNIQTEMNQKLNQALNDLGAQMNQMTEEMSSSSDLNNHLSSIVQKQMISIQKSEAAFASIIKQRDDLLAAKAKLTEELSKPILQTPQPACDHQTLIDSVIEILDSYPEQSQLVQAVKEELANPETDSISRVISAFRMLIEREPSNTTELEAQAKKYSAIVSGLVKFMEQLASSGDVQTWYLDENPNPEEFRSKLLAQVAKVESFLKENGIETVPSSFPELSEKLFDNSNPYNEEFTSAIQSFSFANDALRKYSEELKSQTSQLLSDLKQMRYQLSNSEDKATVEEKISKLEDELSEVKNEKESLSTILENVKSSLRSDSSDAALKCINLINNSSENVENDQEKYLESIEKKLQGLIDRSKEADEENAAAAAQYEEIISDLEAKNKNIETNLEESQTTIDEKESQIDELMKEKAKLEEAEKDLNSQIFALRESLKTQKNYIQSFEELRKKELEEAESKFMEEAKKKQSEFDTQISELNEKIQNAEIDAKDSLKKAKIEAKELVEKAGNEMAIQTQRANELRDHYEPLVAELRKKVSESRESEETAKSLYAKVEAEIKDVKTQLTTSRVDVKMLQMKLSSTEERFARERSLLETKNRMKILGVESEGMAKLEAEKESERRKSHSFLVGICEKFKEFVDFSAPISEDTVLSLLEKVAESNSKYSLELRRRAKNLNEFEELKEILNVEADEVSDKVGELLKKAEEAEKAEGFRSEAEEAIRKAKRAEDDQQKSRDWESWARRLNAIITDSFSTARSGNELRQVIEDSLMSSIGQRNGWRKIEILKAEKQILSSGKVKGKGGKGSVTMRTIIFALSSVNQMQRLSGHLHCQLSLPPTHETVELTPESSPKSSKKSWSIFSTI